MKRVQVTFAPVLLLSALVLLVLSACGGTQQAPSPEEVVPVNSPGEPTDVLDHSEEENQASQPDLPASDEESNLPADRQDVEIPTQDGRKLEGIFYPPKEANSPVVVLMHWAPGSMDDWNHIAAWLQNRPGETDAPPDGRGVIHDPAWFPTMPAAQSFAVLTFNFGKYGASQYGGSRESYVVDAVSALEYAASLPGVDPHRIAVIGASIGADGAVDACYLFNDAGEKGTCIGALSLSPGNYLTQEFTYQHAAEMVNLSGYPVWCLAAEKDGTSPDLCQSLPGQPNRSFIYLGSYHGMDLIDPELMPSDPAVKFNALDLIQEFLEQAYSIRLNDIALP